MSLTLGTADRWRYQETLLSLCTVAMFATMVARISLSPLVPAITSTYGVSNGLMGVVLTGMWFAYGVVQYPSGMVANRFGERATILLALGGTALACLLISLAPVFALFALGAVLLGTVAGLHYSVATALLSRTYDNVGSAVGIHHLGGGIGGLLGPIGAAWLLEQFTWQHAVVAAGAVSAVAFVLFHWRVRPTEPRVAAGGGTSGADALAALKTPTVTGLVVVMMLYMFVMQAVISFLPTFLVEFQGQSAGVAGTVFAAFFIVNTVMQTGIGFLADYVPRDWLVGSCLVFAVAGFGLLVTGRGLVLVGVASLLLGVGTCGMTVLIAQVMDSLPSGDRGTTFGLTQSIVMVGGSLGSVVAGVLADTVGWGGSFTVLGALLAVTLVGYVTGTGIDRAEPAASSSD